MELTHKEMSSRGGKKTLEKYGVDHFKKLNQLSVKKRKHGTKTKQQKRKRFVSSKGGNTSNRGDNNSVCSN